MSKKLAYVTGGMGGIGTAICQRLAQDGHALVAGCGSNSPRKDRRLAEQKALGFDFVASEGNVSDWESTKSAFDTVKAEVGEIAAIVSWLASQQSGFTTGANFACKGGNHMG